MESGVVHHQSHLDRMFRQETGVLELSYINDVKVLFGLASFIKSGSCTEIRLESPNNLRIVNFVLNEIAQGQDTLQRIHFDLWSSETIESVDLFNDAIAAHANSLKEISLWCRFSCEFVSRLIPCFPKTLESLDLSENILSGDSFLDPLITFIEQSELVFLRLANCSMKLHQKNEFVKRLLFTTCPIALEAIEGVDFTDCEEVPRKIKQQLKELPLKTRKKTLGYTEGGIFTAGDLNVQLMDHIRSSLVMKRLVGASVRVWWQATNDENRSCYSGRFWPARVIRVNPLDLTFVVEYDNQEIDHIPCKFVQPVNPFNYGGGLQADYVGCILGQVYWEALQKSIAKFKREYTMSLTPEFRLRGTSVCGNGTTETHCIATTRDDGVKDQNAAMVSSLKRHSNMIIEPNGPNKFGAYESVNDKRSHSTSPSNQHRDTSSAIVRTPRKFDNEKEYTDGQETCAPYNQSPTTATPGYAKSSLTPTQDGDSKEQKKSPQQMFALKAKNNVDIYSIIQKFMHGHGVIPGQTLSDFSTVRFQRNLETCLGLETNMSGSILFPGDMCEFRDVLDIDGTDPSDYVGLVKLVQKQDPYYHCLCIYQDYDSISEVDNNDIRRVALLPWYSWCRLALNIERSILSNRHMHVPQVLSNEFRYVIKLSFEIPDAPPNPLEMETCDLGELLLEYRDIITTHPRAVPPENKRDGKDSPSDPAMFKQLKHKLFKQQQKLDAMTELYTNAIKELEKERNRNMELQSNLKCILCFGNRVDCLLGPCGHFCFCQK
ncbi:bifunctional Leucine-rich repeat domain superfamily/Zinc finger [Babesia duncani]|uniref:Bifunctional Leucine-rich repeat domain superfamily/Zinc finger n=1 Tax=Babesia duncani TaxID=323732 RepID=A0AAD9PM47_9APIC|nr:bifunctional Leucine-rich repeat domain superfamily/Zinc finger [Babesia duncani]